MTRILYNKIKMLVENFDPVTTLSDNVIDYSSATDVKAL